jgi:hypothetical protein
MVLSFLGNKGISTVIKIKKLNKKQMKQTIYAPNTVPTANLAINKSRIKIYNTSGNMPTYYLQKGQEFAIELFNPTSDVVLAKVFLNNKPISQGGLVLNPGQRVFLERYLDVAKKFLFDTYEVSGSAEVQKAIQDNGDFKVEFYKERQPVYYHDYNNITLGTNNIWGPGYRGGCFGGTPDHFLRSRSSGSGIIGQGFSGTLNNTGTSYSSGAASHAEGQNTTASGGASSFTNNLKTSSFSDDTTLGFGSMDMLRDTQPEPTKKLRTRSAKVTRSIETGRVEMGSSSDQEFKYVNKTFEYSPFHTIEYKMLPVSQKVNTVDDIQVKRYCVSCGAKVGRTDKFCASCGKRA